MVTGRGTTRGLAVLTALGMVAVLPGAVGVASAEGLPHYRTARGATAIKGAAIATDASQIKPGLGTDRIDRNTEKYYRIELDARSSAYVSVVAAPRPGTKVEDYSDKLTVDIQDSDGASCTSESSQSFHGDGTPYPIGDYAERLVGGDRTQCQAAGLYYVVVTRKGPETSGPEDWPIELRFVTEPGLKGTAPSAPAEGNWPTRTPPPRTDPTTQPATGGTGFNDAASVTGGVWKDRIRPGETRFYRVPVDWGQRLNLRAELPNASAPGSSSVRDGFGLSVFNPARGLVSGDNFVLYDGKPTTVKEFTAPIAYENRFTTTSAVKAMRFAGWYYLEVTLNSHATRYFPKGTDFILRVDVRNEAKAGPAYAGPAPEFTVTDADREMARTGRAEEAAGGNNTLRAVGYAGIGTGVVLLVGLGVWTLVARRRVVSPGAPGAAAALPPQEGQPAPPQQSQHGGQQQQFGPPQNW
ncbi:hypothetical protein [Streptomyces sp. NPDC048638]|uniref:hypothetical protein n=1 Tax=Streptomyces sp. NPDC048638 TaxID=3365580 RepID=UPI003723EFF5